LVEQMELVNDPLVADLRVLEHLEELESDAKRARGTRHFIFAPTAEAASAIGATLEREGWEVAAHESEDVWLVVAECHRVLDKPLVRQTRARLASLAAAHGGTYDGWEAERLISA
jgi:hypothetical protein